MLLCILQGASVFAYATEEQQPAQEDTASEENSGDDGDEGGLIDIKELVHGDQDEEEDPEAAIVNDGTASLSFADESPLEYCQYIDLT